MAGHAQDRAILCSLAFSDYQLWANPSLRDPNRDGFISIRALFRRSHVLVAASSDNDDVGWTEASVVKCLSTYCNDSFDMRMIIVDKTRLRFAGGYEIRRKDWAEVTHRFPNFSPEYWDARTVYVENIPPSFCSAVGISKLLHALLNSTRVQHIVFPPHHQDPPDAVPKCKGFALVTLNEPDVVSDLLSNFPYDQDSARPPTDGVDGASSVEELEARKAGFRTLSKERWEARQAEYVEYRESLLRRIAAGAPSAEPAPNKIKSTQHTPDELECAPASAPSAEPPRPQSYPPGCVLFARNVPPDTNKTALRARFSALLADANALDYVDYSKGLDSCYLRLTTREHAQVLLEAARSERGASVQELELELLKGRREEMYWENVPEKVRALAVQRVHAQVRQTRTGERDVPGVGPGASGDEEEDTLGPGGASHASGTRKRRRRR